jgi:hypothetical protein
VAPPEGFFIYSGGGSRLTAAVQMVAAGAALARPGQAVENGVLTASFSVGGFGGFGVDFSAAGPTGPQDWSGADGFGFCFHGTGSGLVYRAEISTRV